LVKLLVRFYEPASGTIRLAGADITTLNARDLRSRVVLVGQDPHLFAGTVAENIGLGVAPRDRVVQAARARRLLPLLRTRPGGIDAPVLPRGANLSGGERQLIAFARCAVPRSRSADAGRGHRQRGSRNRAPVGSGNVRTDARPHDAGHRASLLDAGALFAHRRGGRRPRR